MSLPDGTWKLLRQLDLLRIEANYTRQWTRGTRFTRAEPVAPPRFDDAQWPSLSSWWQVELVHVPVPAASCATRSACHPPISVC